MKTISVAMQDHLNTGVTALSMCLAIVRRDGVIVRSTDHDQDIVITTFPFPYHQMNGTYYARTGFERSAIQHVQNAVANAEATSILSAGGLLAEDVLGEKYDSAKVYGFLVSWDDLTRGVVKVPGSGWMGDLTGYPRRGVYKTELRGIGQGLKALVGDNYLPTCRVNLFSSACTKDESDYVQHGVVTAVTDRRTFDSAFVPATWVGSPTAQIIPNADFSSGAMIGWVDELGELLGGLGGDGPWTDQGLVAMWSFQTFGVFQPASVPLGFEYGVRMATPATIVGPTSGDIDAGKAVMDVSAKIRRETTTLLDEGRVGAVFYDALDVQISQNMSAKITSHHGLTDTNTTFTRRVSIPPLARKFAVRFTAIKKDETWPFARLYFDDIAAVATPAPAIALGQDRETNVLSDWFDHGLVVFRSGLNVGIAREIETYDDTTKEFSLFLPLPYPPALNDVFEVYPGCKRRWLSDCVVKFDNGRNVRGEPFVPGDDFVLRDPGVKKTNVTQYTT